MNKNLLSVVNSSGRQAGIFKLGIVLLFLGLCIWVQGQSIMDRLQPVPEKSGFRMEGYWVWGGSPIKVGAEYHLFASRWPRKSVFPDDYFTDSEIVRATSNNPMGPYTFREVVIGERDSMFWDSNMAHNPTIHRINGEYVLFYIGSDFTTLRPGSKRLLRQVGYATSKSIDGPWKRSDKPLISGESNNPAICVGPEKKIRLMYRDENLVVKIAESPEYSGPYVLRNGNVWPAARLEDFYLFKSKGMYHLICEDNQGALTGHERWGTHLISADGISGWQPADPVVAYSHTLLNQSGDTLHCVRRERPQLLIQHHKITHLFTGFYDGQNSWCQPQELKPPLKHIKVGQ
ncbi:MAG TPA: glycoside hydrolase family protein [Prolixibacteraceae bacterium]|nr:glycoside hydrolase family protein [Prolixibacteraceae bacterium]